MFPTFKEKKTGVREEEEVVVVVVVERMAICQTKDQRAKNCVKAATEKKGRDFHESQEVHEESLVLPPWS